jgi:hypothetical protein
MEFLDKFNPGEIIGLAAVIVGPLIAITAIISMHWRRVRIAEIEGVLKQQMLDKGMTAAEIEQVMRAGKDKEGVSGDESEDRAALVQRMVDEGYSGEDIERVLKAYPPISSREEKPTAVPEYRS